MTDAQAIKLVLSGHVEAYETIIRRYQPKIFQLVYRLVWNREEAEDLAQEVMMKSFQSLKTFNQGAAFYPWLHKIAVNTTLSYLKRNYSKSKQREFFEEYYGEEKSSPEKIYETKERVEIVRKALASLPPLYQVVLSLRAVEGLSYNEIATRLNCSTGTVMSRLNRARKKLSERLKGRKS